eukprot:1454614-Rhodomonas_salina.1
MWRRLGADDAEVLVEVDLRGLSLPQHRLQPAHVPRHHDVRQHSPDACAVAHGAARFQSRGKGKCEVCVCVHRAAG